MGRHGGSAHQYRDRRPDDKRLGILRKGVTLQELVRNMNALGVGPRDMISILQAIKADGALQADLEVR